jgi:hypothetical protein
MEHLEFLKNKAVTAVIFTKDNLQLELENAAITCFSFPIFLGTGQDFEPSHPDYKNQLVQLISQPVLLVAEVAKGLVIGFENGELLFQTEGGKELMVVTDDNGEWYSYPDPYYTE